MTSQPTSARSTQNEVSSSSLEKVAVGYRLITYAIFVYFGAVFFAVLVFAGDILLPIAIGNIAIALGSAVALIMSLIGLFRVAAGLRYPLWVQIPLTVGMFLPLINIFVMLSINARATKALKVAGYKVGFLGTYK